MTKTMTDTQIEPYIGHKLVSCVFKKPFSTLKEVQEHYQRVKNVLLQMPILWQVPYH